MTSTAIRTDEISEPAAAAALWANREYRAFLISSGAWVLGSRALDVVIGFQVYELTKSPLSLGFLGFVEAIPALTLVLYGGHFADRHRRRRTAIWARAACALITTLLALAALADAGNVLFILFGTGLLAGCARAFADPAAAALEGEIVPREMAVQSGTMLGGVYQLVSILGPAAGGVAYAVLGAAGVYVGVTALLAASSLLLFCVAERPAPKSDHEELGAFQCIREGLSYVWSSQILLGSMALDFLAVLFGGAVALLPIFATDILQVGPVGFGFLNAAPAVGSFVMMVLALRNPPKRHAGKVFYIAVSGFGCCMIVFGLSESFALSLAILALSGAFDGLSVIVRRAIIRLMAPDAMRGRISAVSTVFIGSSNEIGAFESGVAAAAFGTARSVWLGGMLTLLVVAILAVKAPKLLRLDLGKAQRDPHNSF